MSLIAVMAICLGTSLFLSELFYRLKYPRVVGQLLSGIILGLPLVRVIFTKEDLDVIGFLSQIGIIFLLLLVGLETDLKKIKIVSKDAGLIAFFGVLFPFLFGFVAAKAMVYYNIIGIGSLNPTVVAFVFGAALSLTSESAKIVTLEEVRKLSSRLGMIMISAAIMDDVFEVMFLSVVIVIINKSAVILSTLPFSIMLFIALTWILVKLLPRTIKMIERERSRTSIFSTVLVIGLTIAAVAQIAGIGPLLGAFIAGLFLRWAIKDKKEEHVEVMELKLLTFSLVVPFFFINMGLNFNFSSVLFNPTLFIVTLAAAIAGKMLSSIAVVPFTRDITMKQAVLIGWAMNSRGTIELVIAELARVSSLITVEIYSALVAMSIITTFIFPLVMRSTLKKYPHIME